MDQWKRVPLQSPHTVTFKVSIYVSAFLPISKVRWHLDFCHLIDKIKIEICLLIQIKAIDASRLQSDPSSKQGYVSAWWISHIVSRNKFLGAPRDSAMWRAASNYTFGFSLFWGDRILIRSAYMSKWNCTSTSLSLESYLCSLTIHVDFHHGGPVAN
jgi:hypothetical protein